MRGNDTTHSPAGKTIAVSAERHLNWHRMIRKVLGAPFRLHHYRDLRTRMLRDAVCRMDCGSDDDTIDNIDSTKLCA